MFTFEFGGQVRRYFPTDFSLDILDHHFLHDTRYARFTADPLIIGAREAADFGNQRQQALSRAFAPRVFGSGQIFAQFKGARAVDLRNVGDDRHGLTDQLG